MNLPGPLHIAGAAVDDFNLPRNKSEAVLAIRLPASAAVIEALDIGWAFSAEDATLRHQIARIPLSIELSDCVLSLPSPTGAAFTNYYPERIHKFRLERIPDGAAEIVFRARIVAPTSELAKLLELAEFHLRFVGSTFGCSIVPRQGNLFGDSAATAADSAAATAAAAAGGSRVDLTPPSAAAAAAPPDKEEPPAPPLASAAEMKRRYGKRAAERVN